jgi:asparagine synthase (glutamine-hydrolysing)
MNEFAPLARLATTSAPHGGRPLLAGWIDLDAFVGAGGIGADQAEDGRVRIAAPGLAIDFDAASVTWHVSDAGIVLALGTPTIGGRPARGADLAALGDAKDVGGRFALLRIDRAKRTLRLCTDRFAVWPLCWAREGNRLAFSDRADAVPLNAPRSVDPQALFDYVYFHMIPAPRTVYRGVARLEPASELTFSPAGLSIERVWTPAFAHHRKASVAEMSKRFLITIREAVASEADGGDVGCFLSGGTDSSTVAGMLKRVTVSAPSFSIGFDELGYDEMEYARIAARHFGTTHHEHYVTPAELVAAIPAVAAHYDQPFGNSSAVPAFICASLARAQGVRKLLAGDGGDELFGGNSRYAKQKVFEAWWALPAALRGTLGPVLSNGLTRALPLARKAASYVEQASVPMPARLETYNLLARFGHGAVFNPEFLGQVDAAGPDRLQAEVYARHGEAGFVDRMLAYDWRFTLADNDLPKVCGTTRLAGVAVGFPLLADALVDLSTELAPSDKVRGLRLRHFFKQSLAGFLPPEIIAKKKHGFGLPVGKWLVRDAAFRELAKDSLVSLAGRRLIRATLVDDLFSRRLEEHAGYYGEMVWVLMMLEQWLAAHEPAWALD